MSVFNDFQRLWMERFPQSSLSDAWEQDVRASLERHKLKIAELTKELEQETLYVEYLERLLSDVEKYRESGGDPTTLFEAATNSEGAKQQTSLHPADSTADGENGEGHNAAVGDRNSKSSLNLRESKNGNKEQQTNRLSLNTDNKYAAAVTTTTGTTTANSQYGSNNGNKSSASKNNLPTTASTEERNSEKEDKDVGTEKDKRNSDKNGALHQCISELAASIASNEDNSDNGVTTKSIPERPPKSTSHFVTVIEVKENKTDQGNNSSVSLEQNPDSAGGDCGNMMAPSTFSSFERKPSAPPLSPSLASPSLTASSHALLDAKKKMPPRPPPKIMRRVEPPIVPGSILSSSPKRDSPFVGSTIPLPSSSGSLSSSESPANSLERNIKPSDILRQKSSESSEGKSFAQNRKTTPEMNKFLNNTEFLEELGNKINKTESMEKAKRPDLNYTHSPTGSLGRTQQATQSGGAMASATTRSQHIAQPRPVVGSSPTSSLSKNVKLTAADSSSTGSLDKKSRTSLQPGDAEIVGQQGRTIGSKESLSSQGISEIIKSYESVSSLSSDSARANQMADNEQEHLYDTVPLDNGDDEYVYIKPGRTGSSSSRDDLSTPGSIIPMSSHGHLSSQTSVTDPESPGRSSNYANINYFIQKNNETRSSSVDSDGEYESGGMPIMRTISQDDHNIQTPGALRKNLVSAILVSGSQRGNKIRSILSTIIQSETIYVACLNTMIQYKKAIHATLGTSQPVIKEDEENTIFFKIDELYDAHSLFLSDLKSLVAHEGGDVLIGETFKRLAEMFDLYSAFLHNYNQAIETVKKCSANNPQFKKIVSTIVLNLQTEQSLTLEDLLHKPVARVQINALVFNDLLDCTPQNHPDHHPLKQAHDTIHKFLKQFNVVNQKLPTESNKNLRRMVKNSFIVELVDGHRKLRHLFLFNDVIACAKYKASGRDRIDYELKWFIPLKDVAVFEESDASAELKESSPANILQLKTQACTVRDQLLLEEKDDKSRKPNGLRGGEKYRRKLADLESQLVLASPNLVFRIANKATNKTVTFFLSSDFERTQWIDSILSLQQQCNIPGTSTINALEIHAFIVAMQKSMKTEMGSYLMRNTNDESLLVGDLHMTVHNLSGLDQPADLYISIEVDSYGHYFRKAATKMICRSMNPMWNESFVVELEGSQNVRILLYALQERPILRAKHIIKLSRSWLKETPQGRVLKLGDNLTLNTTLHFVPGEVTLRRVPTSKPGALFGAKMQQVLKREKRDIPFIISACIREVEKRGMSEVGIYRVSGSASDLAKLKKSFETNSYEAEQLLKDVDIHSVTGILKFYLRELPEALFTDVLYPKFFETFSRFSNNNEVERINELLQVFEELPQANKASINHILDHLIRVHNREVDNKMSLHNLAMVFGPTLLRPGATQTKQKDLLASGTVDVMAQAGILYCFLQARMQHEKDAGNM
ncbi:breakpoint cluster region protein isoform X1 [Lucilia cuprina]|uniref:breakpoint cluster region protein isoform X1 n=1 Tax=Lucilia cuprina TaxID=7375 RepID=UPI001F05A1B7|nr:breakpoint cluster region protein isoform X1 [Lucilia cuprina]XP_046803450.1 breakpoint cluster region protein isoform X1 [Lucilia cuprina]XP_046803451.1 breakpoint cluster region protein isoform X1 [Lucilia cuprina]XP_046803452.1 breakpoint cluster region protein isoform X1 [Lucilia cuprina]